MIAAVAIARIRWRPAASSATAMAALMNATRPETP
jgi:hypothetical protein